MATKKETTSVAEKVKSYSFWLGLWKAIKNNLVIWAPALFAFLANVPVKYAPIASVVVYFVKNMLEHKYDFKL